MPRRAAELLLRPLCLLLLRDGARHSPSAHRTAPGLVHVAPSPLRHSFCRVVWADIVLLLSSPGFPAALLARLSGVLAPRFVPSPAFVCQVLGGTVRRFIAARSSLPSLFPGPTLLARLYGVSQSCALSLSVYHSGIRFTVCTEEINHLLAPPCGCGLRRRRRFVERGRCCGPAGAPRTGLRREPL